MFRFFLDNSLFMIVGAVAALSWANLDPDVVEDGKVVHHGSYNTAVHFPLIGADPVHDDEHSQNEKHSGEGGDENKSDEQQHDAHDTSSRGILAWIYARLVQRPASDDDGEDAEKDKPEVVRYSDNATLSSWFVPDQVGKVHNHGLTVHFLINDILMALFFAIAAKEVWEAFLPGGALSSVRQASMPILAAVGGMAGPAAIFVVGCYAVSRAELVSGWAVPCATDIAFSFLVARLIFGKGHPAVTFLLLLAIADDAGGLMILAVFYPQRSLALGWLLLTVAAIVIALVMRRAKIHSFWWYLMIPGVLSWLSFDLAGIHAALGLVPIIPCMPHARIDKGLYVDSKYQQDTLNEFEHFWKNPVELFLGLFALANAGVVMGNMGEGAALVLLGLIVGKPVGITLAALFGQKFLGLRLPYGATYRHIVVVGLIAAIGFTVALFVASAAFPAGSSAQDEVKMGALASIGAAVVAFIAAKLLGVRRSEPAPKPDEDTAEKGEPKEIDET